MLTCPLGALTIRRVTVSGSSRMVFVVVRPPESFAVTAGSR